METNYSNDECIKIFMSDDIIKIENNYQNWFMKNRKLIDRIVERTVNVFIGQQLNGVNCITYVITVFYVLTD